MVLRNCASLRCSAHPTWVHQYCPRELSCRKAVSRDEIPSLRIGPGCGRESSSASTVQCGPGVQSSSTRIGRHGKSVRPITFYILPFRWGIDPWHFLSLLSWYQNSFVFVRSNIVHPLGTEYLFPRRTTWPSVAFSKNPARPVKCAVISISSSATLALVVGPVNLGGCFASACVARIVGS